MWDFEGCQLLISARSPFARRVRLAFLENGVQFSEKVLDVLKPVPELLAFNPLGRVPAVVLKSGEVIYDSHLILQAFYEGRQGSASLLMPRNPQDRLACLQLSVLAAGLSEKIVEYFFETLRPEPHRDPELLKEVQEIADRTLMRGESLLRASPWLMGTQITQADLDFGTALAYLSLRYGAKWQASYPKLSAYLERLEARPSFLATRPPAPVQS